MAHPMLDQIKAHFANHQTLNYCDHCSEPMTAPELVIFDKRHPDQALDLIYQRCTRCYRVRLLSGDLITKT